MKTVVNFQEFISKEISSQRNNVEPYYMQDYISIIPKYSSIILSSHHLPRCSDKLLKNVRDKFNKLIYSYIFCILREYKCVQNRVNLLLLLHMRCFK